MNISIIICTYRRKDKLHNTLLRLSNQNIELNLSYEVIVIDNQPSDEVKELVQKLSSNSKPLLKYIPFESRGLSKARNYGVANAQGKIICFTDDDCLPPENWLANIWDIFQNNNVAALAGPVIPVNYNRISDFLRKRIELFWGPLGFFRLNAIGPICLLKSSQIMPIGANMSFTRICLEALGNFHDNLGAGTNCVGEDTEYFERCLQNGKTLIYDPAISIMHDTDDSRGSFIFILKWYISKIRYMFRRERLAGNSRFSIFFNIVKMTMDKISELLLPKRYKANACLGLKIQ